MGGAQPPSGGSGAPSSSGAGAQQQAPASGSSGYPSSQPSTYGAPPPPSGGSGAGTGTSSGGGGGGGGFSPKQQPVVTSAGTTAYLGPPSGAMPVPASSTAPSSSAAAAAAAPPPAPAVLGARPRGGSGGGLVPPPSQEILAAAGATDAAAAAAAADAPQRPRLGPNLHATCPLLCVSRTDAAGAPDALPLTITSLSFDAVIYVSQAFVRVTMTADYPRAAAGHEDRPVWLFVPKATDATITDLAVENQTRGCVFALAVVPKEDTARFGGGGRSGSGGLTSVDQEILARDPEIFMLPLAPGLPGAD